MKQITHKFFVVLFIGHVSFLSAQKSENDQMEQVRKNWVCAHESYKKWAKQNPEQNHALRAVGFGGVSAVVAIKAVNLTRNGQIIAATACLYAAWHAFAAAKVDWDKLSEEEKKTTKVEKIKGMWEQSDDEKSE